MKTWFKWPKQKICTPYRKAVAYWFLMEPSIRDFWDWMFQHGLTSKRKSCKSCAGRTHWHYEIVYTPVPMSDSQSQESRSANWTHNHINQQSEEIWYPCQTVSHRSHGHPVGPTTISICSQKKFGQSKGLESGRQVPGGCCWSPVENFWAKKLGCKALNVESYGLWKGQCNSSLSVYVHILHLPPSVSLPYIYSQFWPFKK